MAVPTHMPRWGVLKAIPAAAAALAVPAFAEPNPDAHIFALHAEWRKARAAWLDLLSLEDGWPPETLQKYNDQSGALCDASFDALSALLAAQPTTLVGLRLQTDAWRTQHLEDDASDPEYPHLRLLLDSIARLPIAA